MRVEHLACPATGTPSTGRITLVQAAQWYSRRKSAANVAPLNSIVRPLDNIRATLDKDVIAAWAVQLEGRRRGVGRVQLALGIVFAAALACIYVLSWGWAIWVAFLAGFGMVVAQLIDRGSLLCPHCRRPPIDWLQRGTAEGADFCPHCYYWLKTPYLRPRAEAYPSLERTPAGCIVKAHRCHGAAQLNS